MLGVDPPRPLPPAAYDLQTALESVQHFATQTLAGVVQAEATRGFSDFSDHTTLGSGGRSPRQAGGGGAGGRAAKAAAKEKREAGEAAGLVEGWEGAWPPRELTKELGLVTARQMGHTMRCDAEPLIQVWNGMGWHGMGWYRIMAHLHSIAQQCRACSHRASAGSAPAASLSCCEILVLIQVVLPSLPRQLNSNQLN